MPGLGDPFEVMLTPILELEPRASDQVPDGARNEDFAGSSER